MYEEKRACCYLCLSFVLNGFAQRVDPLKAKDVEAQEIWVDSVLNSMSVDEKIGQLFMVQAYSNLDTKHEEFH